MLIKDVKLGSVYLTKVSGQLTHVCVVAILTTDPWNTSNRMRRCRVQRLDTGETLIKLRTAAALRVCECTGHAQ